MFLIIEIIHLNIFKNCSAVELTWELSTEFLLIHQVPTYRMAYCHT